jgi:hypothetical protein
VKLSFKLINKLKIKCFKPRQESQITYKTNISSSKNEIFDVPNRKMLKKSLKLTFSTW